MQNITVCHRNGKFSCVKLADFGAYRARMEFCGFVAISDSENSWLVRISLVSTENMLTSVSIDFYKCIN